jgi:hypothetical protein
MSVPYTFGTATSSIPLSQLDSNFNTAITIGNTAVQLGNTITNLANVSLTNATITSLATPVTVAEGGTGLTTLTSNNVLLGNGTGNVQLVAPGASGNVLISNGTSWVSNAPTAQVYPGSGIANSTGSAWGTSYGTTGTGTTVVLSTSPVLVTPNIGTPTFANLTSATSLPLTTGVTGTLPIANGGTGTTSTTFANLTTNVTGTLPITNGGTGTTSTTFANLTTNVTGTLPIANGGTGLTTTPANGALDIGNGTGFTRTTLTAGSGVTITNASGSITINATGSGGTVTSVSGTAPVSSTGGTTPVISLAASYGDTQNPYASKTANNFLAAPNGSAGAPTFRTIVAADVPTLNQNTTGTAGNVTGVVAIANGGTGQTTAAAAITALAGTQASGQYLRSNGTSTLLSAIQAADVPTLNQNTTGTAGNVTGTVVVANGGTGLTSTPTNGQIDIGNGTGFTRTTLTAGSGVSITNGSGSITIASSSSTTPIKTDLTKYDNVITTSTVLGTSFLGQIAVQVTSTTELIILIGNASAHAVIWDNTNKVFGTPILVRTAVFTSTVNVAAINISSTTVLMCSSVGTALETVVLSVSGTTITVNTAVATTLSTFNNFSTGTTVNNGVGRLIQVGSSYVLNYAGASSFPCFRAITVSVTTPTIGSELTFTAGTNPVNFSNFVISSSVFVSISTTATTLYAVPISVSGTTLTQGTQATTTVTTTNYVAGLLTSNNIAISFLNTNGYAGVVSVAATVATISLGSSTGLSNWSPYMQVVGSQAYVVSSVSNQNYIALLTDTAGVASLQTPVGSPDGVTTQWYLVGASASKVFLQRQATTNTFYTYSISSNSAVLSSVYPFTLLVNATGYTTSLASYSLIYANVENSANLVTSTYKTVPLNTSSNFFTASFDGTGSASYQQAVGFSNNSSNRSALNLYSGWLGYLYYTAAGGSATQSTVYMRRIELS